MVNAVIPFITEFQVKPGRTEGVSRVVVVGSLPFFEGFSPGSPVFLPPFQPLALSCDPWLVVIVWRLPKAPSICLST